MGDLGKFSCVGEELLIAILQLVPPRSLSLVSQCSRALHALGNSEACWVSHVPEAWLATGVHPAKSAELRTREQIPDSSADAASGSGDTGDGDTRDAAQSGAADPESESSPGEAHAADKVRPLPAYAARRRGSSCVGPADTPRPPSRPDTRRAASAQDYRSWRSLAAVAQAEAPAARALSGAEDAVREAMLLLEHGQVSAASRRATSASRARTSSSRAATPSAADDTSAAADDSESES